MIFSYNWLQSFFEKPLPKPEKLAELLTMRSFEVEKVEKFSKDYILDIDVLPNRGPDCFSHKGIAKEIAVLTGIKIKDKKIKIKEKNKLKTKNFVAIDIKDKSNCLRYTLRVIDNIKVADSPKWIQDRLMTCGLKPINNIVDISNYIMIETGQPLHALDFDKLDSSTKDDLKQKEIIVRKAKKGESITTLDNKEIDLDNQILIIADSKEPLAIAGIKGGRKAEIDKDTKTIVLESANFDSKIIRATSKKIGIKTDASWRFEHKIDLNLCESAIDQVADLIQKTAGGDIASGLVDFYPKKALAKKINLNLDYVSQLLGIEIPKKDIIDILRKLGFQIKSHSLKFRKKGNKNLKSEILNIEIPTFRMDISIPEDLVEEIGRIYGYEEIPDVFPVVSLIPVKKNPQIFWKNLAKDILKEIGFTETYNYSFINKQQAKVFRYNINEIIEIENPISKEFQYLRPSLIPGLIKDVKENFKHYNEIYIFELGKIFLKDNVEKRMLSGLIAKKQGKDGFAELKGAIDSLFAKLGIAGVWYDEFQQTPEQSKLSIWNLGKCAEIKVNGKEIGFLGEISSNVLKDLDIKGKMILFDLDFEQLSSFCSEKSEYEPISRHPLAIRDIALLLPKNTKVMEVLNKIESISSPLIKDVDLFDIYEGQELPEGKKNLAFHIIYQAKDRTLTSDEIDKIQEKIIQVLEKDPCWEVRK
ncbi:MAG: phenylalanine--tRNA ligase subunit beta [Patescibacteria group bacterium]|nr:phenylalanine--tRNA ligase subunit beta [Patescibacteria group bacterium]